MIKKETESWLRKTILKNEGKKYQSFKNFSEARKNEILKKIIELNDVDKLESYIENFENCSESFIDEPMLLTKKYLNKIINRLDKGEITKDQVTTWADFLELKEELDYDNDIATILNWLADPYLEGGINSKMIRNIKEILN